MFYASHFTGDISKWNVSNVTNMSQMFQRSSFNGDISDWNVGNVTDMNEMFSCSDFAGDISKLDVKKVKYKFDMLFGCDCVISELHEKLFI